MVTESNFTLHLLHIRSDLVSGTAQNITSAVFSEAGTHVIASTYEIERNILIMNLNTLQVEKPIKLDFSENCDASDFKIYYLSEYF